MTTTLYRLYDETGALLYVGISDRPHARIGQHATTRPWWDDVARIDMERHGTREAAREAEVRAIAGERPRYNVNSGGTAKRAEYKPTVRQSSSLTPEMRARLIRAAARVRTWQNIVAFRNRQRDALFVQLVDAGVSLRRAGNMFDLSHEAVRLIVKKERERQATEAMAS